jgi:hypothetical protein
MADIGRLRALTTLRLSGRFSSQGLSHLGRLEELEVLELIGADLEGCNLSALQSCPKLRELDLSMCKGLTASGVSGLVGIPALRGLYLEGVDIGDEVVPYLCMMSRLEVLNPLGTRISDDGLWQISMALQNCSIYGVSRSQHAR